MAGREFPFSGIANRPTREVMDDVAAPTLKRMRLRYAGVCRSCGVALAAGEPACYDRVAKNVLCLPCADADQPVGSTGQPARAPREPVVPSPRTVPDPQPISAPDVGIAGASARRKHEQLVARREARVKEAHPRIGGLLLAVSEPPQGTRAWEQGAVGEELLGRRLDRLADRGVRVLHDRRIPGSQANIDHLAVSARGVWVIDAKRYKNKRPTLKVTGGLLRPRSESLLVGGRERPKLVAGMHKQLGLVRDALALAGPGAVPVRGMLCFVEADWPLIGGSFTIDGIHVLWPKKAVERLTAPGELDTDGVDRLFRSLAETFPPA